MAFKFMNFKSLYTDFYSQQNFDFPTSQGRDPQKSPYSYLPKTSKSKDRLSITKGEQ